MKFLLEGNKQKSFPRKKGRFNSLKLSCYANTELDLHYDSRVIGEFKLIEQYNKEGEKKCAD